MITVSQTPPATILGGDLSGTADAGYIEGTVLNISSALRPTHLPASPAIAVAGGSITVTKPMVAYAWLVFTGALKHGETIVTFPADAYALWRVDLSGVVFGAGLLTFRASGPTKVTLAAATLAAGVSGLILGLSGAGNMIRFS